MEVGFVSFQMDIYMISFYKPNAFNILKVIFHNFLMCQTCRTIYGKIYVYNLKSNVNIFICFTVVSD